MRDYAYDSIRLHEDWKIRAFEAALEQRNAPDEHEEV